MTRYRVEMLGINDRGGALEIGTNAAVAVWDSVAHANGSKTKHVFVNG